jgi:hypothetical protein
MKQRITSRAPESSSAKLNRRVTNAQKRALTKEELTRPVYQSNEAINKAFHDAFQKKIKKTAEDRRTIRNGSGSSHGF